MPILRAPCSTISASLNMPDAETRRGQTTENLEDRLAPSQFLRSKTQRLDSLASPARSERCWRGVRLKAKYQIPASTPRHSEEMLPGISAAPRKGSQNSPKRVDRH